MERKRLHLVVSLIVVLGLSASLYFWLTRKATDQKRVPQVSAEGGRYADLAPAQKRLVDDWADRFNKVMGTAADKVKLYDELALSTRTTFNAVTHALLQSKLTDGAGRPMNLTALDLVSRVETVAGKIANKGGDKQFRMYVEMQPGAQQTLEKCREFRRSVDNTIYHKGYPTCFRGNSGTPSIQISLSRDGKRGDIDVDYRSSSFPIMLVNGHLTASNSDVRAGDNDRRHNGLWSGLRNWWRGFMGIPLFEAPHADAAAVGRLVASEPRLKKGTKPEEAIYDFLSAWLVEQNPGVAVGYVAPRAFACMELERGVPVDRGMARFQMLRAMQAVNQKFGKVGRLSEAVRGVSLNGPRGKVVTQPHHAEFVLYDVREDLAEQFDCENRLHPELVDQKKARSTDFGEFIGAVFQLKNPSITGEIVATLWAKEKGVWTLVAYDVEPEISGGTIASSMPAAPEAAPLPVVEGDPDMRRAAADFLQAWYLRKDAAAAFRYVSPKSFPCYNVYRPENAPQAGSVEEAGKLIRERMKLLGDWAGTGKRLEDVLVAAEPHHPDLKLVKHDQAKAYAIVSVPDYMGAAADCAALKPGETPHVDHSGPKTHGSFYAASTRLRKAGEDAAVLWTLWAKQEKEWKVVSYLVVTP